MKSVEDLSETTNLKRLRTVFEIIGHKPEDIDTNFGHMLKAFSSGTPPHGGIAWGFDRFLMLLQNEPNIREVIPFPKTGEGRDLMMNAPAPVSDRQLDELTSDCKEKSRVTCGFLL
jgi:aspartyl-tRNA synthetase